MEIEDSYSPLFSSYAMVLPSPQPSHSEQLKNSQTHKLTNMKRLFLQFLLLFAFMTANAQNPYLPLWEHLPDGEPRVFEDPDNPGKYRAYIIGSHDVNYSAYCGPDIRMWSAPVEDLSKWRDEGPIFTWFVNGQWDTMFAPDLVETIDRQTGKKTYWLYPHSRGFGRIAMVCKGDRPDGPFTPVNLTPDGTRCVEGSLIDFDPSVFIEKITDKKDKDYDKGFRAYVFYGFQHSTRTPCTRSVPAPNLSTPSSPPAAPTVVCSTRKVVSTRPSTRDKIHLISISSRLLPSAKWATNT